MQNWQNWQGLGTPRGPHFVEGRYREPVQEELPPPLPKPHVHPSPIENPPTPARTTKLAPVLLAAVLAGGTTGGAIAWATTETRVPTIVQQDAEPAPLGNAFSVPAAAPVRGSSSTTAAV